MESTHGLEGKFVIVLFKVTLQLDCQLDIYIYMEKCNLQDVPVELRLFFHLKNIPVTMTALLFTISIRKYLLPNTKYTIANTKDTILR